MSNIRQKCLICSEWGVRFKKGFLIPKRMVFDYENITPANYTGKGELGPNLGNYLDKIKKSGMVDEKHIDSLVLKDEFSGFLFGWWFNDVCELKGYVEGPKDRNGFSESRQKQYVDVSDVVAVAFKEVKKYGQDKNQKEYAQITDFYMSEEFLSDSEEDQKGIRARFLAEGFIRAQCNDYTGDKKPLAVAATDSFMNDAYKGAAEKLKEISYGAVQFGSATVHLFGFDALEEEEIQEILSNMGGIKKAA